MATYDDTVQVPSDATNTDMIQDESTPLTVNYTCARCGTSLPNISVILSSNETGEVCPTCKIDNGKYIQKDNNDKDQKNHDKGTLFCGNIRKIPYLWRCKNCAKTYEEKDIARGKSEEESNYVCPKCSEYLDPDYAVFIVFDLEMSGPSWTKNSMIELGACSMDSCTGKVLREFSVDVAMLPNTTFDPITLKEFFDDETRPEYEELQKLKKRALAGEGVPLNDAMKLFVEWIDRVVEQDCDGDNVKVQFVSDTVASDPRILSNALEHAGYKPLHVYFGGFRDVMCTSDIIHGLGRITLNDYLKEIREKGWVHRKKMTRERWGIPDFMKPSVPHDHKAVNDAKNIGQSFVIVSNWVDQYPKQLSYFDADAKGNNELMEFFAGDRYANPGDKCEGNGSCLPCNKYDNYHPAPQFLCKFKCSPKPCPLCFKLVPQWILDKNSNHCIKCPATLTDVSAPPSSTGKRITRSSSGTKKYVGSKRGRNLEGRGEEQDS